MTPRSPLAAALHAYPWSFVGFLLLSLVLPKVYELTWLFWMGRLGPGALSVAEQQEFLSITIEVINEAAAIGVLSLVARQAGHRDAARGALGAGLCVSLLGSGVIAALLWLVPDLCIKAIGTPPELMIATRSYLRLRACGLPFDAAGLVLLTALKALERARLALGIGAAGLVLNAGLDLALLSDLRGSLHLGMLGAALGFVLTRIGVCVLAAVACWRLLGGGNDLIGRVRAALPGFLTTGGFAGLDSLVRNCGYAALLTVLNTQGAQAFAGYGLAMTVIWTALLPVLALAEGTNILVGRLCGPDRRTRAPRFAQELDPILAVSAALALAVMGVLVAIGWGGWHDIAAFLNPHAAIAAASYQVFVALAAPYVLFALSQILKSLFIGTGQTRNLFVVSLLVNALLVLPYVLWVRGSGRSPGFDQTLRVFGVALALDFALTASLAWRVRRNLVQP